MGAPRFVLGVIVIVDCGDDGGSNDKRDASVDIDAPVKIDESLQIERSSP